MDKNGLFTLQKGFQKRFFTCQSDIAIGGGSMGAGKTFALIMCVMKHIWDPHYRGAIFRKRRSHIFSSGGLWEEAVKQAAFARVPIKTNLHEMRITYPSGATLQFYHTYHNQRELEEKLQGCQLTTIFIDEASQIDYRAFRFMLGRLRSSSKIQPYVRLTTNPTGGWVKEFVKVFLDEEEYPDLKKCEQKKYLYFIDDVPILRDTKQEIIDEFGIDEMQMKDVKTFQFIPGTVNENKALLQNNPGYLGYLNQLSDYEKNRYLYGCWAERPKDGLFKEGDFSIYTMLPKKVDRAFVVGDTALKAGKNNDYSVFSCWVTSGNGLYLVDIEQGKWAYQSLRQRLIDFLEHHEYVDTCYLEDCGTGTVLLGDLSDSDEVRGIRFRSVSRVSRLTSKVKRAQEARSYLNRIEVFLPFESKIKKKFLKEVCAFSLDMSHSHDDISDTFFDAISILHLDLRRGRDGEETFKGYPKLIENIGGRSFV